MENRPVNSREYKIMLKHQQFEGDEKQLHNKVKEFWKVFRDAIEDIVSIPNNKFNFDELEKQLVRFYDTPNHILYNNSYVFRERIDIEDQKREVTLKFRHRDRYISQARDMKDKDGNDEKQKFEEDIKPDIFVSLYSFSNKLKIKKDKNLNKLNDPGRLFPDLPKRLGADYDGDKNLEVVNDFTAYQIVIEGTSFQIDDEPKLECECALIVWYKKEFTAKPVVAEFSFKYKDKSKTENFSGNAAQKAYDVFQVLQNSPKLQDWIDPKGPTKTKFAYEYSE